MSSTCSSEVEGPSINLTAPSDNHSTRNQEQQRRYATRAEQGQYTTPHLPQPNTPHTYLPSISRLWDQPQSSATYPPSGWPSQTFSRLPNPHQHHSALPRRSGHDQAPNMISQYVINPSGPVSNFQQLANPSIQTAINPSLLDNNSQLPAYSNAPRTFNPFTSPINNPYQMANPHTEGAFNLSLPGATNLGQASQEPAPQPQSTQSRGHRPSSSSHPQREQHELSSGLNVSRLPQKSSHIAAPQKEDRRPQKGGTEPRRKFYARLSEVNGVRTPSKGNTKIHGKHQQCGSKFACPICGAGHKRGDHLRSHFNSCARKNGNPEGYCWDENVSHIKGSELWKEREQLRMKRDRPMYIEKPADGGMSSVSEDDSTRPPNIKKRKTSKVPTLRTRIDGGSERVDAICDAISEFSKEEIAEILRRVQALHNQMQDE